MLKTFANSLSFFWLFIKLVQWESLKLYKDVILKYFEGYHPIHADLSWSMLPWVTQEMYEKELP